MNKISVRLVLSTVVSAVLLLVPAAASASVIYNALPSPLPPNAPSQAFQAQQTSEFGDYIHLGGTDRDLTNITVAMSTWARYSEYTADVRFSSNTTNWTHSITVNVYSDHLGVNGVPDTLLATKTVSIDVPWRPEGDPTCPDTGYGAGFAWRAGDNNCYNGLAFNAVFDLTSLNVTLPNDVVVSLAYNTQSYGSDPIGSNGPYNSLNVLVPASQPVSTGSDDSNNEVFWNTSTASYYTDHGAAGVGIFRKDTNWTPYGTVAMKIEAVTPAGSIEITKYGCPDGTSVVRSANGVGLTVPAGCVSQSGVTFGYVHGTQTDANAPYPELSAPLTAAGSTNGSGVLTVANAPADGRYLIVETDASNQQLPASAVLGLYCQGDGDTSNNNDNQELTFVSANATTKCVAYDKIVPTNSNVHLFKYIDGVQATGVSANNVSFPMFTSTFNAPFTLNPLGWTAGDIAYEASTGPMPLGASYAANEDTTTALVGAECDGSHPYALAGYSVGDTLSAAQQATPTLTAPSFTNLQGEKYVIVRNVTCQVTPPLKVHVLKYLDGAKATAATANNYQFPMTATWNALNIGAGSGSYVLGNNHGGAADQYGADTSPMSAPADYTTSEVTNATSQVVASANQCAAGKYLLNGYRTSLVSFADAAAQPLTATAPAFTGLTSDRYVIVDNSTCVGSGVIKGTKYADYDGDGTLSDGGNHPLSGWTIYLDMNNNSAWDSGEPTTVTGNNGNYQFSSLFAGTYIVREVGQANWIQTVPAAGFYTVVLAAGQTVNKRNFGNFHLGAISGMKFNDLNGNHRKDANEPGLQGWTIVLHRANHTIASVVTDANGAYSFTGLTAGLYRLTEVQQSGWKQTVHPAPVLVHSGTNVANKNFGNKLKVTHPRGHENDNDNDED